MSTHPIRVMLVDDSAVIRGLMARAIQTDPALELAATAMHGQSALTVLRKERVDVVVMDVEMPVMDGITALAIIQKEFPGLHVIMASGLTQAGAEMTVRSLELGAAACIAKPTGSNATESVKKVAGELVPLIKALVPRTSQEDAAHSKKMEAVAVGGRGSTSPLDAGVTRHGNSASNSSRHDENWRPEVLVIGTSTGGPRALQSVLPRLPVDYPLPILIVQHMPPTFTPLLAKHLQQDTKRPCQEAKNGGPVVAGVTYIAPGDFHMEVVRNPAGVITRLNQGAMEHYCRPSVNPLFRSVASIYGKHVLAVMLTGMGEDGLEGTRLLNEVGARIIAQDQATSVVWGMPGAIVRDDLAHEVLPLGEIANAILRWTPSKVTR